MKSPRNSSVHKKVEQTPHLSQKKTESLSPVRATKSGHRTSMYKNEYMRTILKSKDTLENAFYCKICLGKPLLLRNSINEHILKNNTHQNSVKTEDLGDHNKLIQIPSSIKEKNVKSENKTGVEYKEEAKTYLDFLILCSKRRLFFEQTSAVRKYIKLQCKESPNVLFSLSTFDSEELSKIVRLLGKNIMEEVRDDLTKFPFSLAVDNVTISGENVCGFKVQYIKTYKDKDGFIRSRLGNRMIGLKYLGDSSTAPTLLNIIKDKVLVRYSQLKMN